MTGQPRARAILLSLEPAHVGTIQVLEADMTADAARPWTIKGTVLIACNCDFGCPCNFNALPTTGQCEGGWTWHIQEGSFGETTLDHLTFSLCVKWPGAIHHGNGEAILLVDERATDRQERAISTLVDGKVGGPWGVLAWTWPTLHGPTRVAPMSFTSSMAFTPG